MAHVVTPACTPAGTASTAPIFVLGCGHSGTTLLRTILNAHPRLCGGPEHGLFSSVSDWNAPLRTKPRFSGKPQDATRLHQEFCCSNEDMCRRLDRLRNITVVDYARSVLSAYCAAQGKARWVHKHPSAVHMMNHFVQSFPDGRFLYVVRDGRDVACSLAERLGSLREGVSRWVRDNAKMVPFLSLPALLTVKYEALVASPERELRRILCHLGEAYSDRMLRYHEQPHASRCSPPLISADRARATNPPPRGDHERRREWQMRQPISDQSVGSWGGCFAKRKGAARVFEEAGGLAMMRQLGYQP